MDSGLFYWEVTKDHPVRMPGRLDHERCAALHHEIIRRGWIGSGRPLDQLETVNWFQYYGQEAEDCRHLLSQDLVSFLEQAQKIKNDDQFLLFYYVTCLLGPDQMWESFEWMFEDEEEYRYLTLYGAHQEDDSDAASLAIKPILIFASMKSFQLAPRDEQEDPPFQPPYNKLFSVPAGLYFLESERGRIHGFEDAVKLILPFGVGGNGFARTSDGLQIGDRRISEEPSCSNRYTDLYQQGWNHSSRCIRYVWSRSSRVGREWLRKVIGRLAPEESTELSRTLRRPIRKKDGRSL
jgi:hypothetical protein